MGRLSFTQFKKHCEEAGIEKLTPKKYMETIQYLLGLDEADLRSLISHYDKHSIAIKTMAEMLLDPDFRWQTIKDLRDYSSKMVIKEMETTKQLQSAPIPLALQQDVTRLLKNYYNISDEQVDSSEYIKISDGRRTSEEES